MAEGGVPVVKYKRSLTDTVLHVASFGALFVAVSRLLLVEQRVKDLETEVDDIKISLPVPKPPVFFEASPQPRQELDAEETDNTKGAVNVDDVVEDNVVEDNVDDVVEAKAERKRAVMPDDEDEAAPLVKQVTFNDRATRRRPSM